MTVAELVGKLREVDQSAPVLIELRGRDHDVKAVLTVLTLHADNSQSREVVLYAAYDLTIGAH